MLQNITFVHIMSACLSGMQVIGQGVASFVSVLALNAVSRSEMGDIGHVFHGMGPVYLRILVPTAFALYIIAYRDVSLQRRSRQAYAENMRKGRQTNGKRLLPAPEDDDEPLPFDAR